MDPNSHPLKESSLSSIDSLLSSTPTPIKILMLHGHGESSQKFYHKTRSLTSHLKSSFFASYPERPFEFVYLNATHDDEPCTPEMRTWGFGDYQVEKIRGLERSVRYVLDYLGREGPFDGVIGFSTGGAVAILLGALLEGEEEYRQKQEQSLLNITPNITSEKAPEKDVWRGTVFNIPPTPSPSNNHPRLKFIIAYSAFMLGHPMYQALYTPTLSTPTLSYYCELDPIVPPHLTKELAGRCVNGVLESVYGTHFVPRTRDSYKIVEGFIRRVMGMGMQGCGFYCACGGRNEGGSGSSSASGSGGECCVFH
ncbi:serine hydrolase-domain-containing protein [Aspergillus stella-maris]|uniref:serine hydrolase-domain-containing protein n=1 Tax=Aspergillus stella-maris TaxID=1810926 RepID=UPI003CCD4D97